MIGAFSFQCMKAFYLMVDSRVKPLELMCVFDWKLWNKLIYGAVDSCFDKDPDELSVAG